MKEFQNITTKEIQTVGVKSLPDRPNAHSRYGSGAMTAAQLKEAFDALAELIAGRVNEVFESLKDGSFTGAVLLPEDIQEKWGSTKVTLYDFLEWFVTGSIGNYMYIRSPFNTGNKTLRDVFDEMLKYSNDNFAYSAKIVYGEKQDAYLLSLRSANGLSPSVSVKIDIAKGNLDDSVTEYIQGLIDSNYEDTVQPEINEKYSELNIAIGAETNARINDIAEVKHYTVDKLDYDPNTGVLSIIPLEGEARTIDLPLELTVESGYYDADANELVIVLTSGDEARIPVDDLIREVISMPTAASKDVGKVAVVTGENKYKLKIPTCEFATEGLNYSMEDGGFSVSLGDKSIVGKVIVPPMVRQYPVVHIGAFHSGEFTEIDLPGCISEIAMAAFYDCGKLEHITIPKGVTSLGSSTFRDCTSLKDVFIQCDNGIVELTSNAVFLNCDATIHVPKHFLEDYKVATNWAAIADKIVGYETLESLRADVDAAVSQHVTDEESREAAEKRLEDQIATEAETREENDDNLSYQIEELRQAFESTTQALTQTDTEHYNHLVNLFTAIDNLSKVDTQLGTAISNEETKRTTADTDLSNRITNTQAYAEAVNGNLVAVQQNLVAIIQQEQTARANRDTDLQSQINTSAKGQEALQARDDDLQLQIDTINAKLNSFINVAEVGA